MEKQKIEPSVGKEMNFWDLCVTIGRAIGRLGIACWHVLRRMIRLTYRFWWLVVPIVILALVGGYFYSRYDNTTFRINGVALLNGPTIQQFEDAYAPLRSQQLLPENAPIAPYLYGGCVHHFETFRVIDSRHDETADYIDFKCKSKPTDTTNVQMQDRLCIQFRIKVRDMTGIPYIEDALLATLNANPVLQQAYESYLVNLREEVAFNHRQFYKLDSLTSCYYYNVASATIPGVPAENSVAFVGDRKVRLFLNQIYQQHDHMQRIDHRLQMATAPVVLENHLAVDPKPVMGRKKCLAIFFLLSWGFACLLAEIIDQRKEIIAWLKK